MTTAVDAQRKSRSGSENRRRTVHTSLRLLPQQHQAATVVQEALNLSSIQQMMVDACAPLLSAGALDEVGGDRARLEAVANQYGISLVQALLLLSWTTPTGEELAG
jgi:hypothetical protein